MTGYLSNLVKRTLDQPLAVRPRPTAIFEPQPTANSFSSRFPAATRPAPHAHPPRADDRELPSPSDSSPVTLHHRELTTAALQPTPQILIDREEPISPALELKGTLRRGRETERQTTAEPILAPRADWRSEPNEQLIASASQLLTHDAIASPPRPQPRAFSLASPLQRGTAGPDRVRRAESAPVDHEDGPPRTVPPHEAEVRLAPRVKQARASRADALDELRDDSPPIVRITIGRVDVRAIAPSAEVPAPAPASQTHRALSLDDYLTQRRGGLP